MSDNFWTDELVKEFIYKDIDFSQHLMINQAIAIFKEKKQSHNKKNEWEIVTGYNEKGEHKWISKDHYGHISNCEESKCKIHSVRRLSDGLTLSIDDIVHVEFEDGKGFSDTIHHFTKCNDIIDVYFYNGSKAAYALNYLNIKKSKPILFTTEDGVSIYEGDYYWYIRHDDTIGTANSSRPPLPKGKATFSTIEAAKEYVLMNKPCLSIKDVSDIDAATESGKEFVQALIKKAKEKLKQ